MNNDVELPSWYDGEEYSSGGEVKNAFSGESYTLSANELAMYDLIQGAFVFKQFDIARKGLDWFKSDNYKAYEILLKGLDRQI